MVRTATIVTGWTVIAGFLCSTAMAGCNNENIKGHTGILPAQTS